MALAIKKMVENGRVATNYHRISRIRHSSPDSIQISLVSYVDAADREKNPPIGEPFSINVQLIERPTVRGVVRIDIIDGVETPIEGDIQGPPVYLEAPLEPAETLYQRYYQLVKTDADWKDAEDLL